VRISTLESQCGTHILALAPVDGTLYASSVDYTLPGIAQ